jgi:hypothetical protein
MHSSLSPFRHLAAAAVLAAIPLASAPAAAASVPAAVFGPPTICHPIDIGQAQSLPWGGSRFEASADYDLARTVDDTLAILRASPDTLVHMETLRRAAIYLTTLSDVGAAKPAAWREQQLGRLLAALQADVAQCAQSAQDSTKPATSAKSGDSACDASKHAASDAALGLRQFDVGYLQAVLVQSERHDTAGASKLQISDFETWLGKAAALRPDDGALHLGFALATYDSHPPSATCYAHLDKAVALATDPDGLLRRNLMNTMGQFLGAKSYDDLAAQVSAHKRA